LLFEVVRILQHIFSVRADTVIWLSLVKLHTGIVQDLRIRGSVC
jgi:hypothetical protein